jgi:hypothetical protein
VCLWVCGTGVRAGGRQTGVAGATETQREKGDAGAEEKTGNGWYSARERWEESGRCSIGRDDDDALLAAALRGSSCSQWAGFQHCLAAAR